MGPVQIKVMQALADSEQPLSTKELESITGESANTINLGLRSLTMPVGLWVNYTWVVTVPRPYRTFTINERGRLALTRALHEQSVKSRMWKYNHHD